MRRGRGRSWDSSLPPTSSVGVWRRSAPPTATQTTAGAPSRTDRSNGRNALRAAHVVLRAGHLGLPTASQTETQLSVTEIAQTQLVRRSRMPKIQDSIEVQVPVQQAYNQWTQFE